MSDTEDATALIERISPLLAGHASYVQGLALADLLAIWLAGHVEQDADDKVRQAATQRLRELLLRLHIDTVRELIEPYARHLGTW
jgi:hypothetical protein